MIYVYVYRPYEMKILLPAPVSKSNLLLVWEFHWIFCMLRRKAKENMSEKAQGKTSSLYSEYMCVYVTSFISDSLRKTVVCSCVFVSSEL